MSYVQLNVECPQVFYIFEMTNFLLICKIFLII